MKESWVTQRELAEKLDVPVSGLHQAIFNRGGFSKVMAKKVSDKSGIDVKILLYGEPTEIVKAFEEKYGPMKVGGIR